MGYAWALLGLAAIASASSWLDIDAWRAINDGVMGGRSTAAVQGDGGTWVLTGRLSRENNGGFASVRRAVSPPGGDHRAVRLEVRGDGRTYQLRFRPGRDFDGISWSAPFVAGDSWTEVRIPFDAFRPVFRGRPVSSAGSLPLEDIGQLSVLLADGPEGPFRMELKALEYVE